MLFAGVLSRWRRYDMKSEGGCVAAKTSRYFSRFGWSASVVFAGAFSQSAQSAIPASEREVLLALYEDLGGPNWVNSTGWNGQPGSECSWALVSCDSTQTHVTGLNFRENNLSGNLPAIGALTAIESFAAGGNQLTGAIPSLTGLTHLVDFDLEVNQLTGPIPTLVGLSSLRTFFVRGNSLSGSIPSLAGLSSLQYFRVSNNELTGSIPSLAGLTNLRGFQVYVNHLTGSIPSLAGLTNLEYFVAHENELTGTVPSLGDLTSLQYLYLGDNMLSGDLPDVPDPNNLIDANSTVCPNALTPIPNEAWDAATGVTPWYVNCGALPDPVYANGFEVL